MTAIRPLALITGASSGIGAELAELFARDGHDLVLVAESAEIVDTSRTLENHGVTVFPVQADLRTDDGVETTVAAVADTGRPLAAAALNAGVGLGGAFLDQPLRAALDLIDLNVRSTVHLAGRLLPAMVTRGSGRVLITSSVASTMPGPEQAVYNASKSFVQSFTEAIHDELSDTGVTVTSLMPGPTDTNFFARAGLQTSLMGRAKKDDPAAVAEQGYAAMKNGDRKVVAASVMSKAMAAADAVTPDSVKSLAHKVLARPRN